VSVFFFCISATYTAFAAFENNITREGKVHFSSTRINDDLQ
jgi:hypothetical protein